MSRQGKSTSTARSGGSRKDIKGDDRAAGRASWIQFGVSAALVVIVFGFQTWQWEQSLAAANTQWQESLTTSTNQWQSSFDTANEQWRMEGPVLQAVAGSGNVFGSTTIDVDSEGGSPSEARNPYRYTYVLSNTGRSDATILSASLLEEDGTTVVLRELCAVSEFPIVLPAGSSMALGGRSYGSFYWGGSIRVLLSSGVAQTAPILTLADPDADSKVFSEYYADAFDTATTGCPPADFTGGS